MKPLLYICISAFLITLAYFIFAWWAFTKELQYDKDIQARQVEMQQDEQAAKDAEDKYLQEQKRIEETPNNNHGKGALLLG